MKSSLSGKQKRIILLSFALLAWVIFARKGLRLTMSDRQARKRFARRGINLHTETRIIDGHSVHFTWTGNRSLPVLFFIHGSPKSWTFFQDYLCDDILLENYCIVSVDRPGFGHSDFRKAERIPEQARILCSLLDQISPDRPVYLVGHSLGAPVAVTMAAKRPSMIKGLVLAAGALDTGAETAKIWRKFLMIPPVSTLVPGALRPSNEELCYLGEDLFDIQPHFTEVLCPVYLVHAYDDRIVPHQQSENASKLFINSPRVKLVTLPSGGHFFPRTRFSQFRDLLASIA